MTVMSLRIVAAIGLAAACCTAGAAINCPGTPTLDDLVNRCAPEVVFYLGGSLVQWPAIEGVMLTNGVIFDRTQAVGKIFDTSGQTGSGNSVGYIGLGAAGTAGAGKRVLVIAKATQASLAVAEVLGANTGLRKEPTLMTASVKSLAKGIAGTCQVVTFDQQTLIGAVTCDKQGLFSVGWGVDQQKRMHLALSDVSPAELSLGTVPAWKPLAYQSESTAMQGFGVIVNPPLYRALIDRDVAGGRLAQGCMTSELVGQSGADVIHSICQPGITSVDMASLLGGSVRSADAWLGTSQDAHKVVLVNRVKESGVRAATDLMFAGRAAFKVGATQTDGFLEVLTPGAHGDLVVHEADTAGAVINAVKLSTDYALGVVSLASIYRPDPTLSDLKGALFVKVDSMSPNLDVQSDSDNLGRRALKQGYPFALEMQAVRSRLLSGPYAEIAQAIVNGLRQPKSNVPGTACIHSGSAACGTPYTRSGSNLQPLVLSAQ
jgi:hypothetical protein